MILIAGPCGDAEYPGTQCTCMATLSCGWQCHISGWSWCDLKRRSQMTKFALLFTHSKYRGRSTYGLVACYCECEAYTSYRAENSHFNSPKYSCCFVNESYSSCAGSNYSLINSHTYDPSLWLIKVEFNQPQDVTVSKSRTAQLGVDSLEAVSYTHLTLPTRRWV